MELIVTVLSNYVLLFCCRVEFAYPDCRFYTNNKIMFICNSTGVEKNQRYALPRRLKQIS